MTSEPVESRPGGVREIVLWWIRTSGGWVRLGHLGLRALAVLVLVLGLVLPWGPVSRADDVDDGPTAQEAAEAREAVNAGELDVAEAEEALAHLREELSDARVRMQSAAADYQDAVVALESAQDEVRAAREAAEQAGEAEAEARTTLAGVYRATRHTRGAEALGSLEVVFEAESVDDLIGQSAAERAVGRKLAVALSDYSDARAASESADARWTAAREARAEAKATAEAAYRAAGDAVADVERRTEAAERDRVALIERLAELRDTSVRIEREREEARAAAERTRQEAAARAALEAAQAEAQDRERPDGGAGRPAPAPEPADPAPVPEPRPAPAPVPDAPERPGVDAMGQVAVDWARTKIGSPYELGAAGPDAYDCSGLTSEAWKHAGKWITRTSRSQYLAVGHISYDVLRPGDLIFYGTNRSDPQSIYHVTMYTGGGRMIEAVMPGVPLRETDLRLSDAMPYAGRP